LQRGGFANDHLPLNSVQLHLPTTELPLTLWAWLVDMYEAASNKANAISRVAGQVFIGFMMSSWHQLDN